MIKTVSITIVLLLIFLRLYQFGSIPYGVNRDEAALGYNAYLLLNTFRDEHGRFLPLSLESFGDWKKPLYAYVAMVPIAIAGLSPVTVRLISFAFAILMAILLAKLVQMTYDTTLRKPTSQSKKANTSCSIQWILYYALALIIFNPWHFFFSRVALEATVAAALFVISYYWLIQEKYVSAVIALSLTFYTYHAALVFIPLWLAWYVLVKIYSGISFKKLLPFAFVFGIAAVQIYQAVFSPEQAKASGLVIYDLSVSQQQEIMSRRTHPWSILIHNKYVYITQNLFSNYIKNFSPEFLLTKGGQNPSYNVPTFGNFFPVEILLAIIGLWYLIKSKSPHRPLLLGWLLIAPLPAAITFDAAHSTRGVFMMPIIVLLAALGAVNLVMHFRFPKTTYAVIAALYLLSSGSFFYQYFSYYQKQSDKLYHGYLKSIVTDAKKQKDSAKYERVVIEFHRDSPYIFYAFYNQIDPQTFLDTIQYYPHDHEGFIHAKSVDGIYFEGRDEESIALKELTKGNNLVYSKSSEVESWIEPLSIWHNLEGESTITSWEESQI